MEDWKERPEEAESEEEAMVWRKRVFWLLRPSERMKRQNYSDGLNKGGCSGRRFNVVAVLKDAVSKLSNRAVLRS